MQWVFYLMYQDFRPWWRKLCTDLFCNNTDLFRLEFHILLMRKKNPQSLCYAFKGIYFLWGLFIGNHNINTFAIILLLYVMSLQDEGAIVAFHNFLWVVRSVWTMFRIHCYEKKTECYENCKIWVQISP